LVALMFVTLGFAGNFWYYLAVLLVGSLGMTLVSGNDTATLHALSPDFQRDQSQVKFWVTIVQVVSTALGSILLRLNLGLPFWINGLFLLVAAWLMLSVRSVPQAKAEGHPLATGLRALGYAFSHPEVRRVLALIGLVGAFFLSIKWFFNPLLQGLHVPLDLWGTLIGVTLVAPLAGIWFYRHQKTGSHLRLAMIGFALMIAPLGLTSMGLWPLAVLYAAMAIYGYLDIELSVRLNAAIQVAERASILSLASLYQRLGTSIYTPIAGFALARSSLATVMLGTAVMLALLTLPVVSRLLDSKA
jgi:MFS family permease